MLITTYCQSQLGETEQPVIGFSVIEEIIRVTPGKAYALFSQRVQLLTSALHLEGNGAKLTPN